MCRQFVVIGVAVCLVLGSVWSAFMPASVGASELNQAAANSEGPPEVQRLEYLFEDSEGAVGEEATESGEASSDLAALEKIAPQPRAMSAVAPYVPEPSGLSATVDRGCGSVYNEGEFLTIHVSLPESGYLTVWSSTDGRPWERLRGPVWVQASTIPIYNGYIVYPVGNELLFARLRTTEGEILETVCHYVSVPVPNSPMPGSSPDPSIPVPAPEPLPPELPGTLPLECSVSVPTQVTPGATFRQYISVTNPAGGVPATEIIFYARISPAGYLPVYFCLPNCDVVSGRLTSSLGTLYPGETTVVRIDGSGPTFAGARFDLSYSTQSAELAETVCADASFVVDELDTVMEEEQEEQEVP